MGPLLDYSHDGYGNDAASSVGVDDDNGDNNKDWGKFADDSGYESGFDNRLARDSDTLASEEEKRHRTGDIPGGIDVDSPWVSWTGWAEHFQGKDIMQISQMRKGLLSDAKLKRVWSANEKHRQQKLRFITDSFERVMSQCTARLKLVPHETRRQLNSMDPITLHRKPMQLKDHKSSMADYKRYAARYVCY